MAWVYLPTCRYSAEPVGSTLGLNWSVGSAPSPTSSMTDTPKAC